ncbi:MAG: transposase [Gemmatimonadetes bacterium]|nr:transposase [Gemmatimonadota bacterium]
MGEDQCSLFSPDFNRSIHIEARADRLSSDAGALLLRQLMERLGYTALFRKHLSDARDPDRVTHPFRSCCAPCC